MTGKLRTLRRSFGASLLSLLVLLSSAATVVPQGKEKLKPEELIAKHLDAIGPQEARSSLKSIIAAGTVEVMIRGGRGVSRLAGSSVLGSTNNKNLLNFSFNDPEYPFERIAFNGDKVTGAFLKPGIRSPLINFLLSYDAIIKQGLLGGTLSAAWPLRNLTEKNPKLEYAGLKKIEGRQLHELRYSPRKGGEVKISLFFDAETFQHVRTEYRKSIAGQIAGGGIDASKEGSGETRYQMVEEFGDFKKEGALMLPHDYKLTLKIDTPGQSMYMEWAAKMVKFAFDQEIPDNEFSIATQ
ncbi:MAG TPA: hypothetical protein VGC66_08110 [Pyrinomonadaceae bacterium]|jgi:hypothetical protein